jgi:hypothetical protein
MPEPLRLADLNSQRIAFTIVGLVVERTLRDTTRLRFVIKTAEEGGDESAARSSAIRQSEVFSAAWALAEWATAGRGQAAAIPAVLQQVRADLEGISVDEASSRGEADLATVSGVGLVAAGARLAVVEGRTVSAVELATLASVDEHSIRAAVKAGTLRPVAPGRPMRFAADLAHAYLYTRGVLGFAAPKAPPA